MSKEVNRVDWQKEEISGSKEEEYIGRWNELVEIRQEEEGV